MKKTTVYLPDDLKAALKRVGCAGTERGGTHPRGDKQANGRAGAAAAAIAAV